MDMTNGGSEKHPSQLKVGPSVFRILAYLGLGLATTLAIWRIEGVADTAHDVAVDFQAAEDREDKEEAREAQNNCAIRNTAIRNGRNRVNSLLDGVLFVMNRNETDPAEIIENEEIVARLRDSVSADGAEEDLDCDGDGALTEADYAP